MESSYYITPAVFFLYHLLVHCTLREGPFLIDISATERVVGEDREVLFYVLTTS